MEPGTPNRFLTDLFQQAQENIAEENRQYAEEHKNYLDTMGLAKEIIDEIVDGDSALTASQRMKSLKHYLTSEKESKAIFSEKMKELGLKWDRVEKRYVQTN